MLAFTGLRELLVWKREFILAVRNLLSNSVYDSQV
jgi:hypothetical protein